jgi:hypothetical protein
MSWIATIKTLKKAIAIAPPPNGRSDTPPDLKELPIS